jgi:hypothetical protein
MTFQEWWDSRRLDTVPYEATASCFAKAAWDAALKQSKPEPICPSCHSGKVECLVFHDEGFFAFCVCCSIAGPVEPTIDAALEHWRPAKGPQNSPI